jgi:hypothetical protein
VSELQTEIEINASAGTVWRVLTDFALYPEWNPFIRSLQGELVVGNRLCATIKPPGSREITFRPLVLVAVPDRALCWLGHLWVPGLFDGEHAFRIEPVDGDRVRFIHRERFKGILLPLLWKSLDRDARRGFEDMNRAIKDRSESPTA